MSAFPERDFPRLTLSNHRLTSPADANYNCIAWAAGDTDHWWQPDRFWPTAVSQDDFSIAVLEQAFRSIGYEDCGDDESFEVGFEKVALYGNNIFYTHAAKQIANGKWSSKLGKVEDIEHDSPDAVAGGVYGEVVEILRRPLSS